MVALRLVPLVVDEVDTVVVDPADPEEDVMQVKLLDEDGVERWHRWMPESNGSSTACGLSVPGGHNRGTRYPVCIGELCEHCFTVFELTRAAIANAAERRRLT